MSKKAKKARKMAQRKKVQKRFKARVAAGKSGLTGGKKGTGPAGKKGSTISIYRAAQKKQVQDAAKKRNETFQANKKLKAAGGTSAQVAKDNQMYGNTVPEGSFSISAAAKAQAEKNKAEAAAKKEATRKSTFDSGRLFGNYNAQIGGKLATTFADTFAKPKYMYQGNMAGRLPGLSNYFTPDVGTGIPYTKGGNLRGIPFTGGDKTGSLTKFKVPDGAKLSRSPLGVRQFKLDPSQMKKVGMGVTDDATKFAAKGLGKYGLRAVPFIGAVPSLIDAGVRLKDKDYTGAALSAASAIPGKVGWASLAGLAAHDINKSMNVGTETQTASTDVGGLNIGGGVDSGEAEGSKTGRTIFGISGKDVKNFGTFTSNLLQQPKAALAYSADVINQAFAPRLGDGTLKGNMDFAGNLPGDKGFDNRDVQIKSAVNNAMDSKFVQQYGENLGLPKNFKGQTKAALAALSENYQGATADRDGIYKGTSETLKNLSSDKRLAPIAKYLNQLGTENENVTDADRKKKFSMMGFETPINNETAADIITAFQPNVEGMPGLSRADRGLIEGSGGNRIISGKLTDIAREAITGNIGTGDSLGIEKGTPLTIGNMLDAGSTIASNLQNPDTLASKRSAEIGRLADKAGKITTPSLIKGLIPRFGGSGSFRPNSVSSLGGGATTLAAATPTSVEEVLPLPTTATQTGTDSGNLAGIMQNAYQNQLSLYGMNPNYFASFQQPRFNTRPRRFRQVFNRGYF